VVQPQTITCLIALGDTTSVYNSADIPKLMVLQIITWYEMYMYVYDTI